MPPKNRKEKRTLPHTLLTFFVSFFTEVLPIVKKKYYLVPIFICKTQPPQRKKII